MRAEERGESKPGKQLISGIWEKEIQKFFALFVQIFCSSVIMSK